MSSIIVEEWRDLWPFKVNFLLVGCSFVFSTGNLLNLPTLILHNGGCTKNVRILFAFLEFSVAFLSALATIIVICVLPIIVMELTVGQLTGRAPIQAFYNICPLFKGVGMAQILLSIVIMSYASMFIAWLLLFVFHLFWTVFNDFDGLPWIDCQAFSQLSIHDPCLHLVEKAQSSNVSIVQDFTVDQMRYSIEWFISNLQRSSEGIVDVGQFQWKLLLALTIVWILVFLFIVASVRWIGKLFYFTYPLALILLLTLFIPTLTRNDFVDSLVTFYNATNWENLLDRQVWKKAAEQAVTTTGIGLGAFITLGSYNRRKNNAICDGFVVVFSHLFVTTLQLCTIVGLIGLISTKMTPNSPEMLVSNDDWQMWNLLLYMHYLPVEKVFTCVLLLLLILMTLHVLSVLSLNVLASLEDAFGEKMSRCFPRLVLALFVCILGCLSGLFYTTQAGKYAVELVKSHVGYVTLLVILFFELLAVAWFYCAHNLGTDLRKMQLKTGFWILGYFLMYITYLLPIVPILLLVGTVVDYQSIHEHSPGVSSWHSSELLGWSIALLPLLPILIWMFYVIISTCLKGPGATKWQRFKYTIISPLRYEVIKQTPPHRYTASAPGYVLLPRAPLAEAEHYNDVFTDRVVRVSNVL